MYRELQQRLADRLRAFVRHKYEVDLQNVVVEQPPNVQLGEYALTIAFGLAKALRKPPRAIAQEIASQIGDIEGFERLEVAGGGYLNAYLDRSSLAALLLSQQAQPGSQDALKVLVEHTSINPNKAAHIGHLRNAILGDSFVRLLRAASRRVDVQNYIDNTGVQVADVVAGFLFMQGKSASEVMALTQSDTHFDYTCWDLYAQVGHWYGESELNAARRVEVLHAIEAGNNDVARAADVVSTTIVRYHLRTMQRLGIEYDFLPRESEILHLHFWDAAFEQLKAKGVIWKETQGAKAGCWVTRRPKTASAAAAAQGAVTAPPAELTDDDIKVIVRSNGTVVYEGKDIAYHLWKFGLLGRDFGYQRFFTYADARECWISAGQGEREHPHFGGVHEIYNVIDARQQEAQNTVIAALRGLGYTAAANHYHHFSYEMVALTPRCAAELGYQLAEEDRGRSYIEVSGRKGFGVKADDLIDRLIASARKEVDARHPEIGEVERQRIATQIAVGALRYFMLKFTKNSVIAFDFNEALSFEGETGPYCQYAVVRAGNIFRKAGATPEQSLAAGTLDLSRFFQGDTGDEFWELWLAASKTGYVVEQCIAATEPAHLAKHAFQLAQAFNNFYHRHHILTEQDEEKKRFLLATAAVVQRELIRSLAILGIEAPEVM